MAHIDPERLKPRRVNAPLAEVQSLLREVNEVDDRLDAIGDALRGFKANYATGPVSNEAIEGAQLAVGGSRSELEVLKSYLERLKELASENRDRLDALVKS